MNLTIKKKITSDDYDDLIDDEALEYWRELEKEVQRSEMTIREMDEQLEKLQRSIGDDRKQSGNKIKAASAPSLPTAKEVEIIYAYSWPLVSVHNGFKFKMTWRGCSSFHTMFTPCSIW